MLHAAGPTYRPLLRTVPKVTLRQEYPVFGTPSALDQGSEVRYQGSDDPEAHLIRPV